MFRLLRLSSALEDRGESSRKQSSVKSLHTIYSYNNDCTYWIHSIYSLNFLNKLNLLLLEQYFWKLLRANSLAVRLKTARGYTAILLSCNSYPNIHPHCDVSYSPTQYRIIFLPLLKLCKNAEKKLIS